MDWKEVEILQALAILAVATIAVYMDDKDIANVAVGGLIGFLSGKALRTS